MRLLKFFIKNACCLLIATGILCFLSCSTEDNKPVKTPIEIYECFSPVLTPMVDSSIIALPHGVVAEQAIVNSREELYNKIPKQIINENPEYKKIDFENLSLIVFKLRMVFKPQKIEYIIYKEDSYTYEVIQRLYQEEVLRKDGLFVMSCVVTEKIATDSKLNVLQSASSPE